MPLSASFSSSSRFFSAVICSSFCRASKRSFCTSEGSAAEFAAGVPPFAACNTSFMVGFFLPNRPDILLRRGLAAAGGCVKYRNDERAARCHGRSAKQLTFTCVLANAMRRVAQSTRHLKRGCFPLDDYDAARPCTRVFDGSFGSTTIVAAQLRASVYAQHALTWHYG